MSYQKIDYRENIKEAQARFITSMGEFTADLFIDQAPTTCWNFINLAEGRQPNSKEGSFFNETVFHYVNRETMIKGGCPLGNGYGDPGYRFKGEISTDLKHQKGTISMTNLGTSDSCGSQFLIALKPLPLWDGVLSIFGQVTQGMDMVEKISQVEVNESKRPKLTVFLKAVEIAR